MGKSCAGNYERARRGAARANARRVNEKVFNLQSTTIRGRQEGPPLVTVCAAIRRIKAAVMGVTVDTIKDGALWLQEPANLQPCFSPRLRLEMYHLIYDMIIFSSRRSGDAMNYPKKGNTVIVHYTGTLQNGTEFDSSRKRGDKFSFKIGALPFPSIQRDQCSKSPRSR